MTGSILGTVSFLIGGVGVGTGGTLTGSVGKVSFFGGFGVGVGTGGTTSGTFGTVSFFGGFGVGVGTGGTTTGSFGFGGSGSTGSVVLVLVMLLSGAVVFVLLSVFEMVLFGSVVLVLFVFLSGTVVFVLLRGRSSSSDSWLSTST